MKRNGLTSLPNVVVTDHGEGLAAELTYRRTPHAEHLAHWASQVIHNPRLLARVLEANKALPEGERIRAWHPSQWRYPARFAHMMVPRGEVIRRHGRAAWERIDRRHIRKDGKREYATLTGYVEAGIL